jgi:hypothetical protein
MFHRFDTKNRVAERPAHPIKNRRPQQECLDVAGLPRQHFFGQIVENQAVAAGKRTDEAGAIAAIPHCEGRQMQPGDPPLGACLERGDLGGRKRQSHHFSEKLRRLVGSKSKIDGVDLGQQAARAQARER